MNYLPSPELREILLPSHNPCLGFQGVCKGLATWNPKQGHVPRGFIGALGALGEVQVVILVAEPSDPHDKESYVFNDTLMTQTCKYKFGVYRDKIYPYHRNLRILLDCIFPDTTLEQQLRNAWIVDTYLCSAPKKSSPIDKRKVEQGCAERFLVKQLEILEGRPIVALGRKAQKRIGRYIPALRPHIIEAVHPSSRYSNAKKRSSYEGAAKKIRRLIQAST